MNEDLKQLRKKMDGDDPFMAGGHQIIKVRSREKVVPVWANSNLETQKILLRAFPKLATNPRQRKSAARWGLIIHLFYRVNLTTGQIAEELNTKPSTIKLVLQHIRRAARGVKANNTGPLGARPVGRPKKSVIPSTDPM
jgi:hypothetical protein